ncbi:hypothetical protein ACFE04_019597 [Oxalis oulophora]
MCKLTFLSECYSFFWPDLVKKGRLMNDQSLEEDYDSLSIDLDPDFEVSTHLEKERDTPTGKGTGSGKPSSEDLVARRSNRDFVRLAILTVDDCSNQYVRSFFPIQRGKAVDPLRLFSSGDSSNLQARETCGRNQGREAQLSYTISREQSCTLGRTDSKKRGKIESWQSDPLYTHLPIRGKVLTLGLGINPDLGAKLGSEVINLHAKATKPPLYPYLASPYV